MSLNKTQLRTMRDLLREALRASTFETAHFGSVYADETAHVRKITQMYRESWIMPGIDCSLRIIERELGESEKPTSHCPYCGNIH